MAELGALSLRIEEQGGGVVLQKLKQVDDAARLTKSDIPITVTMDRPGAEAARKALEGLDVKTADLTARAQATATALNRLGIDARAVGGSIQVPRDQAKRTAEALQDLGIGFQHTQERAKQARTEIDAATASVQKLERAAAGAARMTGDVFKMKELRGTEGAARLTADAGAMKGLRGTEGAARLSADAAAWKELLAAEAAAKAGAVELAAANTKLSATQKEVASSATVAAVEVQKIGTAAKIVATELKATPFSTFKKIGTDASSGLGKATTASKALNKEIADGTRVWALQARTVDTSNAQLVGALKRSGAEQLRWMQSVGASDQQLLRHAANIQTFQRRLDTTGAAVTRMSPKIRSGAAAMAALAIVATTGGGSLAGMATQAGLVGSVMAAEFAPAKWAGYAAGIGAVVIGIAALIGIMSKLREEARKPSELVLKQIQDIKQLDLAEQALAQRREARDRLGAEVAALPGFVSPHEQAAAQKRRNFLEAEFEKSKTVVAEAEKKMQELRNQSIKEGAETAVQAMTTAAEATKGVRLSELAKEQAQVEAAFQSGTQSLAEQYAGRRKVVIDGAKAERDAMEAQRAALLKVLPGEDPKGAAVAGRRVEAGGVSSQIKTLANETAARLTALDQQRANEEQALAAKVFGYQVQLEQITNTSFEHRMTQIRAEDLERRRMLNQRGNATQEEKDALDELRTKQEAQLRLQVQMVEIERLRANLALRLQDIENQRLAGLIDEEQASREIAAANREGLPEIQRKVDLAIAWAEKLGDQGVLGALKAIRAELAQPILLNIDIQTDAITARLQAAIAKIQAAVNAGALDKKTGAQLVKQQEFAAGFASAISDALAQGAVAGLQGKNPLAALGQALSSSLGSLMVDFGRQALAASVIMAKLQTALALMNPWAAAAIAASLIIFGTAIGGRGGSGGVSSGGVSSSTAPSPISISRLVVDPNAGVRQRIASSGMQQTAGATGPVQVIEVIGVSTPRGQALIGSASAQYQRRGG